MITSEQISGNRILSRVIGYTLDDKITWRVSSFNKETGKVMYSSSIEITNNKKLVLQLSSNMFDVKGNYLRVALKTLLPNHHMLMLRKLDIDEHRMLVSLLRLVNDRFFKEIPEKEIE